ncbi:MAG: cell division protein ZapA [Muribaculaceae bacterium]|nr:cell division protein ZapA [Muribaculaceae bacterium]
MATNDDKINIWIRLGDVKQPIPLSVNRDEEADYRNAENLVNTLWNKWMARFNDTSSSHEVMARVAFQFARLYAQAYNSNVALNDFLATFEKQLDDVVMKV